MRCLECRRKSACPLTECTPGRPRQIAEPYSVNRTALDQTARKTQRTRRAQRTQRMVGRLTSPHRMAKWPSPVVPFEFFVLLVLFVSFVLEPLAPVLCVGP